MAKNQQEAGKTCTHASVSWQQLLKPAERLCQGHRQQALKCNN